MRKEEALKFKPILRLLKRLTPDNRKKIFEIISRLDDDTVEFISSCVNKSLKTSAPSDLKKIIKDECKTCGQLKSVLREFSEKGAGSDNKRKVLRKNGGSLTSVLKSVADFIYSAYIG